MSKLKREIWVLDQKIRWQTFKLVKDKLSKKQGLVPIGMDKMLWQLLKENKLYCWYDTNKKGEMHVGLELPKVKAKVEMSIIR